MKLSKLAHVSWRFLKNRKHQRKLKLALIIFVVLNVCLAFFYSNRAYPRTTIGSLRVSNQSFGSIKADLEGLVTERSNIEVTNQEIKASISTNELGLRINSDSTLDNIRKQRSWLPVINLLRSHSVYVAADLNEKVYSEKLVQIKALFQIPPSDSALKLQGNEFIITEPKDGFELNETEFRNDLIQAFATNKGSFSAPINIIKPKITKHQLIESQKNIQAKLSLDIKFKFIDKEHKATGNEIGGWFETRGADFKPSATQISKSLLEISKQLGMKNLGNKDQATAALVTSLDNNQALNFTLEVPLEVTYKYCAKLKNVDNSAFDEFSTKAASVYSDSRSWNLGGKVRFSRVENGCDYTLWLSAADQMPSFGGVCDSDYSCQIGNNVVINYDRWRYTTEAWKGGGGSVDDYRAMVINHETGHWLGFGHLNCSGPGQIAPVMQQQSINLQGCKFNPWPTQGERNTLDARI